MSTLSTTAFTNQIQSEFDANSDALIQEFPERLETQNGYEPSLDWGEFILARIETAYPELDEDETEELLEEVREELCV